MPKTKITKKNKADKEVFITLVKSTIGAIPAHKKTIRALGLRKINHCVRKIATPSVLGMIKKTSHLLKVEDVK